MSTQFPCGNCPGAVFIRLHYQTEYRIPDKYLLADLNYNALAYKHFVGNNLPKKTSISFERSAR